MHADYSSTNCSSNACSLNETHRSTDGIAY
jgi:hypothetical protein